MFEWVIEAANVLQQVPSLRNHARVFELRHHPGTIMRQPDPSIIYGDFSIHETREKAAFGSILVTNEQPHIPFLNIRQTYKQPRTIVAHRRLIGTFMVLRNWTLSIFIIRLARSRTLLDTFNGSLMTSKLGQALGYSLHGLTHLLWRAATV